MIQVRPPAINLARRPFRNNTIYYGVFITCFVLLTAASGYNVYDFVNTGGELSRLGDEYAYRYQKYLALRDEVEKMKKDVNGLDLTTLNAKSTFANGLILSRLFSWSLLFDRIEDLLPPSARIRSIRPSISPKGIEIQVDGMARAPEDLYEFEDDLANSDFFSAVYPLSENSKEGRGELNFDLSMSYIPGGRTRTDTATRLPATPTEGLPQPEPVEGASQPVADPNAPVPASGAPEDAGAAAMAAVQQEVAPGTSLTAPPGAEPADPPVTAAAEPIEPVPAQVVPQEITRPPKPPREMTNKEFLDWGGRERFDRIRGKLRPTAASKDSALSNEEFLNKHGLEEFLKTRGGLKGTEQRSVAAPRAGARP